MWTTGHGARFEQATTGIHRFLDIHRPTTVSTMRVILRVTLSEIGGQVELFPGAFHSGSLANPQGCVKPPDAAKPPPRACSEGRWLLSTDAQTMEREDVCRQSGPGTSALQFERVVAWTPRLRMVSKELSTHP